jgi:hypothetical protein
VSAPLPRGTLASPATPRLYYCGWQDTVANLLAVRAAVQGIAGARVIPGMAWGLERDIDGVSDPAAGDATTKRTRGGALRYVASQLGISLSVNEAG